MRFVAKVGVYIVMAMAAISMVPAVAPQFAALEARQTECEQYKYYIYSGGTLQCFDTSDNECQICQN